MTARDDLDRQIDSFLQNGPTDLRGPAFDSVRDRIERSGQRVVIGPWRLLEMNKIVTLGVGATAVVVAVVLGIRLFGSPPGGLGVQPVEEPAPSAVAGLPDGPYLLSDGTEGGVPITVTIDGRHWNVNGCWSDAATGIAGDPRPVAALEGPGPACGGPPDGAGLITFQSDEYLVYGDACHYEPPPPPHPNTTATTVDELAQALAGQVHRWKSGGIEDVTVDGYAGKKVILQLAGDAIFSGNDCEDDAYVLFGLPDDPLARFSDGPHQTEELWIVDVDGLIVVLDAVYYPDTPPRVVDELRAMLASATFDAP